MQSEYRVDPSGSVRGGQVDELLAAALRSLQHGETTATTTTTSATTDTARPSVLDCGGGSGRFAVPLAAAGAVVTVVDISIDALSTLRRRAIEAGVAERIVALQGDVEAIADVVPAGTFDLVLAHGILEVVEPLHGAFGAIAATVRPGGLLSVLVGNPVAGVLARALAGDLVGAEREFAALDSELAGPGPGVVAQLSVEHGLIVEKVHGIGVFRDLVPGSALDMPAARDALERLDDASAQRSPFAEIAGRVHLLLRRPLS